MSELDHKATVPQRKKLMLRAFLLGFNLALIMFAGYLLKPSSRSVFLEYLGAEKLAWPWIFSGLLLLCLMPLYSRLLQHYSRRRVISSTCFVFALVCVALWLIVQRPSALGAMLLYVFVDVVVVVLVEQAWALVGLSFSHVHSRIWHGFIGSFGILGAILAGVAAAALVQGTWLDSTDLILCAGLVLLPVGLIQWPLSWLPSDKAVLRSEPNVFEPERFSRLIHNRPLILVLAVLLLGQITAPFIEFIFLSAVEEKFILADYRTAYLGIFFSIVSTLALLFNLILTPLLHRYLGVAAGLIAQPLMVSVAASGLLFTPGLYFAELLKLSERSFTYSVTRASRELLYVRANIKAIFTIKSWLDVVGYRLFKLIGSVALLLTVQWLPIAQSRDIACVAVLLLSLSWIAAVLVLEWRRWRFD